MMIFVSTSATIIYILFFIVYITALCNKKWVNTSPGLTAITFIFLVIASVYSPIGGDKSRYIAAFLNAPSLEYVKDPGWTWLTKSLYNVTFGNEYAYLFIIAILYVAGYYIVGRAKLGKENTLYFLLLSAACLGFWSGATNIMRAGLATSIFLVSLKYLDKKYIYIALSLASVFIHNSLLILVVGFFITNYFRKYKILSLVWVITLIASYFNVLGFVVEYMSSSMGEVGDRIADYATYSEDTALVYHKSGFRWDFVIYSVVAIVYSLWIMGNKKFSDKFYERLVCTYIIANCFWLVMIRAQYGDRFSALSWGLIPLIVLYPVMNKKDPISFNTVTIVVAFAFTTLNILLYYISILS
jgi:hypothetical protein